MKIIECFTVCWLLLAGSLSAGVVGVTGNFSIDYINLQGTPGYTNLAVNNVESSSFVFAFNERSGVTLASNLVLNPSTTISAGTIVDSHLLHYDMQGNNTTTKSGTVTFSKPILGVIYGSSLLVASDFLGIAGTTFSSTSVRGTLDGGDTISFSGNTVTVSWSAPKDTLDELRVITEGTVTASPEPEEAILIGLGMLFAMFGLRRSRSIASLRDG